MNARLFASFLGIFATIPSILKEKEREDYSLGITLMSLLGILIWLVHYYRTKDWVSAGEILFALILNLQILYVILTTPKPEKPSASQQFSDGLSGYTFEECIQ